MRVLSAGAGGDAGQDLRARTVGPERIEEAAGGGVRGTAGQTDFADDGARCRADGILFQLNAVAKPDCDRRNAGARGGSTGVSGGDGNRGESGGGDVCG